MQFKNKINNFIKGAKGKAVFLVSLRKDRDDLYSFFEHLPEERSLNHLFVFFNIKKTDRFTKSYLNIKLSEDFLTKKEYEEIDYYVFSNLSASWYLYRNVTDYKEIQLGNIVENDFLKYLVPRIKNIEIILRIFEQGPIDRIIVVDDNGELCDSARLFGNHFKIPLLEISFKKEGIIKSWLPALRANFASFAVSIIDRYILNKFIKNLQREEVILIDARLHDYFKNQVDGPKLLRLPLEKGLGLRLNLFNSKEFFLPLSAYNNIGHRLSRHKNYQGVFKALLSDNNFIKIFTYKNIPILDMIYDKLSSIFLEDFPRICENIDLVRGLCEKNNVKLVVLRNDSKELEKTVIYTCRLFNIPSLAVQHGVLALDNGHYIVIADKVAVWGQASIEKYKRFGNDIRKFEITGNPRFDILPDWRPKITRELFFRKLGLDVHKKTILFASQQVNKFTSYWTDDFFIAMAREIINLIKESVNKQLIIKTDPYEDPGSYKEMIRRGNYNNISIAENMHIYDLLFYSDILLTLDSTVGLEAMLFDKPVVTLNLGKRKDRVLYAEKGAAIGVYKKEDLPLAIEKVLTDQNTIEQLKLGRKTFIEEYAYKIDGKASERITNFIKRIINSKPTVQKLAIK